MLPPSGAFTLFSSEAWGPGRGQEGTFVGPHVGLLKSHPSKSICRPELLTTETCLSCFFFFLIVAHYLPSPPSLHVSVISVVILEQGGCFLFILS